MDAVPSQHPSDQVLSSYGSGKLDDAPADEVNKDLEECAGCRERVAALSADSFLGRVRGAETTDKATYAQSRAGDARRHARRTTAAPPSADSLSSGLADHPDYEIKKELGRGGMGVVYLAHNTLMGREEVLKVMGRQIIERPGLLDRFLREIRAVARLRHPNIVAAYHATRLGENIVFAMEYVEGLDLSRLVKAKGPLPVSHACNFIHQAALGLQHAHEEGLVHRDIKPGNLMLSRKGDKATVKVLDFGLAKVTREQKVDGGLTSEGQALGTPDFIAPEQILDAQSADIRADIYSLGGTLYYLLTGRPPFRANSLYDIYQAHISRDAELLNLVRPEVPSELAALVAKMMAKDPARRFQTPGEVAEALKPFFKKGSMAFQSPQTDLSQTGQLDPSLLVPRGVSTRTQPATDAPGPVVRATRAPEPTVAEERWESLIDLKGEKSSLKPTPTVARSRRPPWAWPAVVVGVLVFGVLAAWVAVVKFKTSEGVVALRNLPNDAEVLVDGQKATISWPGGGKPAEVRAIPGQHKVEVKKDRFKTYGDVVTFTTVEQQEVTVSLEPLVVVRPGENDSAQKPSASPVDGMTKTESGLRYLDLVVGSGEKPSSGQTYVVHYTGWLWEDGRKGKQFDSSFDRGQPSEFPQGKVIAGWAEGLSTMRVGGRRRLLIPPSLAYGDKGAGAGAIPSGATLLFEIQLLDLKPANPLKQAASGSGQLPAEVVEKRAAADPSVQNPGLTPDASHPAFPDTIVSGTWRTEGNELIQSGGAGTILLGDKPLSSYDLRFSGQIVTGKEGFNALFHRADDDNFRFFHVGEYGGETVVAGFLFHGKEGGKSKPVATEKGRWYNVMVKVRGAEFWCYVDDKELFHQSDKRFTNGWIGLATWGGDARYRNIVITTPDGRELWSGLPDVTGQAAGGRGR